jgi:hypothetical protein
MHNSELSLMTLELFNPNTLLNNFFFLTSRRTEDGLVNPSSNALVQLLSSTVQAAAFRFARSSAKKASASVRRFFVG